MTQKKKKETKDADGFIEIPLGAFDSETIGWTYTIPEGFSAKIENGKIIVEKENESDDEEIRKWLIGYMKDEIDGDEFTPEGVKKANKAIAWLEKKKEQKPAGWSEEDERNYEYLHQIICNYINNPQIEYKKRERASEELIPFWERLKSLRPQPHWKPSEEQLLQLRCVISGCSYDIEPLVSLEEKLEKL